MKRFNQASQKLSAAVAVSVLAASAFMLSACGGGEDKAIESLIKKENPNALLLSFDEAKKEVGLTDKECLREEVRGGGYSYYYFVKIDNEIKFVDVYFSKDNKPSMVGRYFRNVDLLKTQNDEFREPKPECFN